jgi:hypothetical protein
MHRSFSHAPLAVVLLAVATGVSPAQTQIQSRPTPGGLPPAQTQAYSQPTGGVASGPTYVQAPSYGYGYPGYPTIQGPVAGQLNGTANVISSYGQYSMDVNQARLTNQQVEQEKIRTRRMLIDQDRYERSLQPTANQAAAARRATDLQAARNDPPPVQIWSGSTLNTLLAAIQDAQTKTGVRGPAVPLDSATLAHINVGGGTSRGPVTMLRQGGRLRWPFSLQTDSFGEERQKINQLLPQAIKEVQGDGLQRATYESLNGAVGELKSKITASAPDMSLSDIVSAKGYAEQVGDLVTLLKDPSAANYFNGTWEAKGSSVAELVDNMTRGGLTFAPAAEPDRPFYSSLYRSLLTYDSGIVQLVRR